MEWNIIALLLGFIIVPFVALAALLYGGFWALSIGQRLSAFFARKEAEKERALALLAWSFKEDKKHKH